MYADSRASSSANAAVSHSTFHAQNYALGLFDGWLLISFVFDYQTSTAFAATYAKQPTIILMNKRPGAE